MYIYIYTYIYIYIYIYTYIYVYIEHWGDSPTKALRTEHDEKWVEANHERKSNKQTRG